MAVTDHELDLIDAYWRAANYLSVGQIYLLDNPLLREPLAPEHIKPRLLGHFGTTPGLNLVYAHLNRLIRARALDAIFIAGPGHGGPGTRRQRVPRGHLHRALHPHHPGRRGHARAVSPVLVSRRHPEPRRARDARIDPRGRRARLRARPCLRRGLRQSRSAGRMRRRRRGGRDRSPGGELALDTLSQSGRRRGRAPDPAPERLQDRQPDHPRAHPRRRAGLAVCRLRLAPARGRRRRARPGAPRPGRRARRRGRRDRRDPARGAQRRAIRACPLADDRPAHAQGLDGPEGRRRAPDRGHLAFPPGPGHRRPRQPGASGDPGGLAALVPPGRALRRAWGPRRGPGRARAARAPGG